MSSCCDQAAASQSSTQEMNMESETATQKLVSELAADKSTSWRKTPEEEVLERLAATTCMFFFSSIRICY